MSIQKKVSPHFVLIVGEDSSSLSLGSESTTDKHFHVLTAISVADFPHLLDTELPNMVLHGSKDGSAVDLILRYADSEKLSERIDRLVAEKWGINL